MIKDIFISSINGNKAYDNHCKNNIKIYIVNKIIKYFYNRLLKQKPLDCSCRGRCADDDGEVDGVDDDIGEERLKEVIGSKDEGILEVVVDEFIGSIALSEVFKSFSLKYFMGSILGEIFEIGEVNEAGTLVDDAIEARDWYGKFSLIWEGVEVKAGVLQSEGILIGEDIESRDGDCLAGSREL